MSVRLTSMAGLLGVAGLLPFGFCAVEALTAGAWHDFALLALVGYGAVVLAFLGAVHWGLALAGTSEAVKPSVALRLALGVVPSLIGWAALLVAFAGQPELAIGVLLTGFVATVATELRWAKLGLLPAGYMTLRWLLSVLVVIILGTTLFLRLIGASIVL